MSSWAKVMETVVRERRPALVGYAYLMTGSRVEAINRARHRMVVEQHKSVVAAASAASLAFGALAVAAVMTGANTQTPAGQTTTTTSDSMTSDDATSDDSMDDSAETHSEDPSDD